MAGCPGGSRIKPSVTEDKFWISVGDALEQLEGVLGAVKVQFFAQIMQQVAPSLVDLNEMCADDPPEPPAVDLDEVIRSGQWNSIPHWLAQWFWATWAANRWSTWCECNPSTGPGPCPSVPEFANTGAGAFNATRKLVGRVPVPHGWNSASITRRRGTDGQPGMVNVGYQFEDANHLPLGQSPFNNEVSFNPGVTYTITDTGMNTAALRNNVRYFGIWTQSSGGGGQVNSTEYPFQTYASVTFTGTCQDVETPVPPPTPPPPPPDPTLPLPPIGPIGCSTDTLCTMIYQLQRELHDLVVRFNAAQRYGLPFAYVPGTQHVGLSAAGSFPISGLVGLRVDITSPLPTRQLEGTPAYIWDLGWMSIITPEGMIDEKRITRDTQIWQPRMIQEATTFGYFLKEDVAATVTELYPEPF